MSLLYNESDEMSQEMIEIEGLITETKKDYKQVIIVRTDIKMSRGKLAAQVAHASVSSSELTRRIYNDIWKKWYNSGQKKIILRINSVEELYDLKYILDEKDIVTEMISDAGHTESGTVTCLGVGPHNSKLIDSCTGDLDLL